MRRKQKSRWVIVLSAWPWQGALFIAASFCSTVRWLCEGSSGAEPCQASGWLEPLAHIVPLKRMKRRVAEIIEG